MRTAVAECADRGEVGQTGRQAVVDHDHGSSLHVDRGPAVAIALNPAAQLPGLTFERRLEYGLGHTHLAGGPGVYHSRAILGNGSHAKLGIPRSAQLAHRQDVQRRVERARHLDADRHAAARKGDDHRPLLREGQKLGGQTTTRVVTIEELHSMIISGTTCTARPGNAQSSARRTTEDPRCASA